MTEHVRALIVGSGFSGPAARSSCRGWAWTTSSSSEARTSAARGATTRTPAAVATCRHRSTPSPSLPTRVGASCTRPNRRSRPTRDLAKARTRVVVQRVYNRAHGPEVVADAVLSAVRRDRAVVPAGLEARIGWHLAEIMPVAVTELLGRPARAWLTRGRRG